MRVLPFCLTLCLAAATSSAQSPIAEGPRTAGLQMSSTPFQVNPGKAYSMPISAPVKGTIWGAAVARGGMNNDIRVVVLRDNQVLYDSGQRRYIEVSVPVEAGQYAVVFDNRFSAVSGKTVWSDIRFAQDKEVAPDQENTQPSPPQAPPRDPRRVAMVQEVGQQLIPAFRNIESAAGIRKPTKVPGWWTDDGLFAIAEANPKHYQDILAWAMGHELAHLVQWQTAGKKRPSNNAGDFWREMSGTIAWAARDEEDAVDRTTVNLVCKAGFDSTAVLGLIEQFMASAKDSSSPQYHPRLPERLEKLRSVARCTSDR